MKSHFKNHTSRLTLALALGLPLTLMALSTAHGADLSRGGGNDFGSDCCAELEERVDSLESTRITKGNRRVSLKMTGFVNRGILIWDDGNESDIYSVGGADDYSSRFSLKGKAKIGSGWSAGFLLEWMANDTAINSVIQNNDDGDNDASGVSLRHSTLYFNHDRYGTLSTGHSSQATDGVSEVDLSGADVVAYSLASDWIAGFDTGAGKWGNYIDNIDGGRADIILRYDSPNVKGFTLSTSFGEDDYWDVALRYAGEISRQFLVAGAVGYRQLSDTETSGEDIDYVHGSISVMHPLTGLNATYATGYREQGDAKADFHYVKAGMFRRVSRLGKTAIYGEYGIYNDFAVENSNGGQVFLPLIEGSKAEVWGLGIVQNIDAAAMEIYAGYRNYSLDITGADNPEDINAVFVGARIKF